MTTTVGDLMTTDVVTLAAEDDLVSADALMRVEHIRHLPVVSGKRLVGLVTHRDVLKAQARLLANTGGGEAKTLLPLELRQLMTSDVATTSPNTPAMEAAAALLDHKFGCLPVISNDELVGIVTEADFLKWALGMLSIE